MLAVSCTGSHTSKQADSPKATLTLLDSIFLTEGFDTTAAYTDPVCLQYKGKPLLTIGENVKKLDTTFSYRYDPNGKYDRHFPTITDCLSLDDYYSVTLSTGSISGALYFSADKQGRVFRLHGQWIIDAELVDTSGMEIMNFLTTKYFHCLPPDFKGRKNFELTHKNYTEKFKLYPSPENSSISGWRLDYSVVLTKKEGL
ncbi:hypothetical protein CLV42_105366 [Chitinophaga ginsengisoli]|uniref:Uncharacterized protein n=2 Tax=Chitinophaga ginsengisoli TaxID=363837 RepID=A0A2P8GAL9_9BACT|nr:hypothetical protein CLV42_105366 [Chitinophaga ginsengisoli]